MLAPSKLPRNEASDRHSMPSPATLSTTRKLASRKRKARVPVLTSQKTMKKTTLCERGEKRGWGSWQAVVRGSGLEDKAPAREDTAPWLPSILLDTSML